MCQSYQITMQTYFSTSCQKMSGISQEVYTLPSKYSFQLMHPLKKHHSRPLNFDSNSRSATKNLHFSLTTVSKRAHARVLVVCKETINHACIVRSYSMFLFVNFWNNLTLVGSQICQRSIENFIGPNSKGRCDSCINKLHYLQGRTQLCIVVDHTVQCYPMKICQQHHGRSLLSQFYPL